MIVTTLPLAILLFVCSLLLVVPQVDAVPVYVAANSTCTSSCGSSATPYSTIGEALQAVSTGGQVIVRSGVYTGANNYNLTITSADLQLTTRSESGDPDTTIIDCAHQGPGLIVKSGTYTMQGLTIRNCVAENGGGMLINSTYTILKEMKFTGNSATNDGGSVYIWSNSVEVYNSTVGDSSSDNNGGGVYLESANLKLYNSHLTGNSADQSGNQLYCKSAAVQIDRLSSIDGAVSAECNQCSVTYMDGGEVGACAPASSRVGGSSALWTAAHQLLAALC